MKNVNFQPWIGKNYQNGLGSTGLKVLVLGESHYCFTLGQGKCPGCSLENCIKAGFTKEDFEEQTTEYIKDILYNNRGLPYQQTPLSFERAVFGKKDLTQAEREEFWNSIAFYNYIQKALPKLDGKRTEFTTDDLAGADIALEEVVATLHPDRIIVWGYRLFEKLPPWCGKSIPALKVAHPSCPQGRRWKHWHQFYEVFLK